jgi:hypothetical protein
MGQYVRTEVKNHIGRADAVVWTADAIYVFEFKMDDSATAESALAQIDSRDYAIPYTADHRKLVKVGVEFSVADGGVKRWKFADERTVLHRKAIDGNSTSSCTARGNNFIFV